GSLDNITFRQEADSGTDADMGGRVSSHCQSDKRVDQMCVEFRHLAVGRTGLVHCIVAGHHHVVGYPEPIQPPLLRFPRDRASIVGWFGEKRQYTDFHVLLLNSRNSDSSEPCQWRDQPELTRVYGKPSTGPRLYAKRQSPGELPPSACRLCW